MIGAVIVPADFDAETPVGGLPPILRHALALQAAGAAAVHVIGTETHHSADSRLRVPLLNGAPGAVAALVVRADTTCHRLLPKRVAANPPADDAVTLARGSGAWIAFAGASRTASVIAAASEGVRPADAIEIPLEAGEFVLPASTAADRARAMHPHLRSLVKPTGGVIDRHLMRPISLQMTRALCRTPVTPNAVSVVSLLMAAAAAALVAMPGAAFGIAGAALHVFMRIVDCVDGELARLRYQHSRLGEWLDTVGDGFGIAVLVAAVASRAAGDSTEPRWLVVGAIGVVAWMMMSAFQYAALVRGGGRGSLQYVEWGHRRSGERSAFERVVSATEMLFRIDVISVSYAALIAGRQLPLLLVVHATAALAGSAYFGAQLFWRRPAVNPDRAQ